MRVVELSEAKAHWEQFATECQTSPVVVTVEGKPAFELVPIRADDPDFIDRLLEQNVDFRRLMEQRHQQSRSGKVSSIADVRQRLND